MKNILLLFFVIAVSLSFSCSSSNKSSSNKNGNTDKPEWTTLDYHYRTGSVAPEYYYHYRVLVNNDKSAQLIFYYSYGDTGFTNDSFTITDSQLEELNIAVINSKVLDADIQSEKDHPIGGSSESLTVLIVNPNPDLDQSPKKIDVPPFPDKKYEAGLDKLYRVINGLVPAGMMETAKSKKEEMYK